MTCDLFRLTDVAVIIVGVDVCSHAHYSIEIFPVPVRLHSGYGKLILVIISPSFAIFKNVVHSLEPGETPSNSAYPAQNYAKRS